ncbi:MAG: hypothetical protein ACLFM0_09240 [Spirochaetales bacterium]
MTMDIDYFGFLVACGLSIAMTIAVTAFSIELMHNVYYIGDWTIAPAARLMVVPIGILGFIVLSITPPVFRSARERLHLLPRFCWWMAVQSALLAGLLAGRVVLLARIAGGEGEQIIELLGGDSYRIAAAFGLAAVAFAIAGIVTRKRLSARGL